MPIPVLLETGDVVFTTLKKIEQAKKNAFAVSVETEEKLVPLHTRRISTKQTEKHEQRSKAARTRFAKQAANMGVLKRRQQGTMQTHVARMIEARKGWAALRKSGPEGEKVYQEYKHGKGIRDAWKKWKKPPVKTS